MTRRKEKQARPKPTISATKTDRQARKLRQAKRMKAKWPPLWL